MLKLSGGPAPTRVAIEGLGLSRGAPRRRDARDAEPCEIHRSSWRTSPRDRFSANRGRAPTEANVRLLRLPPEGEGGVRATVRDARQACSRPNGFGAILRSKTRWIHGFPQFTPSIAFCYVLHRCVEPRYPPPRVVWFGETTTTSRRARSDRATGARCFVVRFLARSAPGLVVRREGRRGPPRPCAGTTAGGLLASRTGRGDGGDGLALALRPR